MVFKFHFNLPGRKGIWVSCSINPLLSPKSAHQARWAVPPRSAAPRARLETGAVATEAESLASDLG